MTKLTVVNNTKNLEQATHKIGDFYLRNGIIFVLGMVDYTDAVLMGLDGNRYTSQATVSNSKSITALEFQLLSGGDEFTKIESLTTTIN